MEFAKRGRNCFAAFLPLLLSENGQMIGDHIPKLVSLDGKSESEYHKDEREKREVHNLGGAMNDYHL